MSLPRPGASGRGPLTQPTALYPARWVFNARSRSAHRRRVTLAVVLFSLGMTGPAGAAQQAAASGAAPAVGSEPVAPSSPAPADRRLWVVNHGWHTGLVLRADDVPVEAWPARAGFGDAGYFEIGWGDRDFYRATDPGAWLALKAVAWPSPGVLHVVAVVGTLDVLFGAAEIVEIAVSSPGLARLLARLRSSHALDDQGQPAVLGPGLYGQSRFYASHERFHAFKTCNVWVATMLQTAGVPVSPAQALTAAGLMAQLRALPQPPVAPRAASDAR